MADEQHSTRGGEKGSWSNEWLLKTSLDGTGARNIANKNGFQVMQQPFPGYYLLQRDDVSKMSDIPAPLDVDDSLKKPNIEYIKQLKYLNRTTRDTPHRRVTDSMNITDSYWQHMWHVREDQFPEMGVGEAWVKGYSGVGIHVNVLDDGVEPWHTDLAPNYDHTYSYDYLEDSTYVNHTESDFHGTWCAGIISAAKNDECILGIAYNSKFSSVKIFDAYWGLNAVGESLALTHELPTTDIYSNSWGPIDSGEIFEAPDEIVQNALLTGVTEGRQGKGAIYTWAAGNGGIYDDCNCDGYASSIYTISTTSIGHDQAPSWYSEECSSILAGTYSGDSPDLTIATTDTGGGCTTSFQGTSASCPMASGMVALALEANSALTWRDIQHLIVETSVTEGLILANWQTNGARKQVSHAFGFGLMNADAMITRAQSWILVPQQHVCESENIVTNRVSSNGVYIISNHDSDACDIVYTEHVEVWMSFSATYRGSLQITLTSPQETKSRMLRTRRFDVFNGTTEWTFMTVHSWGENPSGEWSLQMETFDSSSVFGLNSWKINVYGTQSTPLMGNTEAQVSGEESSDDSTTWSIVGGVVGGVALFAVVGGALYYFIKKPKDPTVYPTGSNGHTNGIYQ